MILGGKYITDLSLDPSVSPNLAGFDDWKLGVVGGRGRIVNNTFVVCGGGVNIKNR